MQRGGMVVVLLAIVAAGCASPPTPAARGAVDELAEDLAKTVAARAVMDPEATWQLGGHPQVVLQEALTPPDGVEAVEVLDAGATYQSRSGDDAVAVDAAVGLTLEGREGPVCALLAATTQGRSSGSTVVDVAVDDCHLGVEGRMRSPFRSGHELLPDP